MVWFKVDDTLAFHEKTVRAGNAAMGMWVRAGSWAAQTLTDGFIPDHIAKAIGTKAQAQALVDANLWHREDGGYRFHQWGEDGRQPTREDVESKRSEWREKKRRQRRDGAGQYAASPSVSLGDTPGDSPRESRRPVPSRPDPTQENSSRGGSDVSSGPLSAPPRFPDHCPAHADVAVPGKCGSCKDQREANAVKATAPDYRLRIVPGLCGECDDRWIDTPTGYEHCPRCHPAEVRTA